MRLNLERLSALPVREAKNVKTEEMQFGIRFLKKWLPKENQKKILQRREGNSLEDSDEIQKEKEVTTGTTTLDPLLRMGISDNDGIKYKISDFLNTRLDEINIETMDDTINSAQYRRLLSEYFKGLPEEQKDNLTANLKKIRSRMTREGKKEKKTYTSKEINVDIGKYLGATNLSKSSVREDIYDYWAEVAKDYQPFKDALDNFFKEASEFFDDILNYIDT